MSAHPNPNPEQTRREDQLKIGAVTNRKSVLKNGTVFITGHLLAQDVRNEWGYTTGFLHRSTDGGRTWQSTRIESAGIKPKARASTTVLSLNSIGT